ncbi:MAG: hypothetical protein L0J23_06465, partial [Bifidobacterium crudilactis]|nr:hypothetical protein [Bifidobacterium crudilactis]
MSGTDNASENASGTDNASETGKASDADQRRQGSASSERQNDLGSTDTSLNAFSKAPKGKRPWL